MSKHTPGPWWTTDHGIRDAGGYIAHTNSVQHYAGQEERYAFEVAQRAADKRLIAAAPDLLEALEWCADTLAVFVEDGSAAQDSVVGTNLTAARAAIAKATGEQA